MILSQDVQSYFITESSLFFQKAAVVKENVTQLPPPKKYRNKI